MSGYLLTKDIKTGDTVFQINAIIIRGKQFFLNFDDEKYNISELWNGTTYNYWYAPKFLDGEYVP